MYVAQPSGVDDVLLFEAANESFSNKPDETELKLEHMQPKWCMRHGGDDSSDGTNKSCMNLNDDNTSTS